MERRASSEPTQNHPRSAIFSPCGMRRKFALRGGFGRRLEARRSMTGHPLGTSDCISVSLSARASTEQAESADEEQTESAGLRHTLHTRTRSQLRSASASAAAATGDQTAISVERIGTGATERISSRGKRRCWRRCTKGVEDINSATINGQIIEVRRPLLREGSSLDADGDGSSD